MSDDEKQGASIREEVGARLREVETEFVNRSAAADAAGVSKSTFQRWIDGQTDITLDAVAKLASAAGYSLEWVAFGIGPKRREIDDDAVAAAVAGGWIDGDLLEEILSKVRRFMLARRTPLTLELYQRLGSELYNLVARFPTAPERNAALQVLLEQRVPAAFEALSAHDRIAAKRFWSAPEEPSK